VGDLKNASLTGAFRFMPQMQQLGKVLEDNFPEMLGFCVLVNAPTFANKCWKAVKDYLDPKIVQKVGFVSNKEELVELFGSVVLPKEFGGNNPIELPRGVYKLLS
jgi:hypothetical protein